MRVDTSVSTTRMRERQWKAMESFSDMQAL
jgi:hypothetical protein